MSSSHPRTPWSVSQDRDSTTALIPARGGVVAPSHCCEGVSPAAAAERAAFPALCLVEPGGCFGGVEDRPISSKSADTWLIQLNSDRPAASSRNRSRRSCSAGVYPPRCPCLMIASYARNRWNRVQGGRRACSSGKTCGYYLPPRCSRSSAVASAEDGGPLLLAAG